MCLCSSSIPACTCSWPWEKAKTNFLQGGGGSPISPSLYLQYSLHLSLPLSVFNCLLNHVVHLFIYADNLILSKVVSYITSYYNHILSVPLILPVCLCLVQWPLSSPPRSHSAPSRHQWWCADSHSRASWPGRWTPGLRSQWNAAGWWLTHSWCCRTVERSRAKSNTEPQQASWGREGFVDVKKEEWFKEGFK